MSRSLNSFTSRNHIELLITSNLNKLLLFFEKFQYELSRHRLEALIGDNVQVEQMIDVIIDETDHNGMNGLHALANLIEQPQAKVELRPPGAGRDQKRVSLDTLVEEVDS